MDMEALELVIDTLKNQNFYDISDEEMEEFWKEFDCLSKGLKAAVIREKGWIYPTRILTDGENAIVIIDGFSSYGDCYGTTLQKACKDFNLTEEDFR